MKVRVLKQFIDKNTKKLNEVGSIIDVSKERLNEILEVGLLVEVINKPKAKVESVVENVENSDA